MPGSKRVDIDFIGYTYKGDVEQEKLKLVNVLKDLDTIVSNDTLMSGQSSSN